MGGGTGVWMWGSNRRGFEWRGWVGGEENLWGIGMLDGNADVKGEVGLKMELGGKSARWSMVI